MPGTAERFAEAISRLLADERERARMESRGRALAAEFEASVIAPKMLEMYEEVAARGRPASAVRY